MNESDNKIIDQAYEQMKLLYGEEVSTDWFRNNKDNGLQDYRNIRGE